MEGLELWANETFLASRLTDANGMECFGKLMNLTDEKRLETEYSTGGDIRWQSLGTGRSVIAGLQAKF